MDLQLVEINKTQVIKYDIIYRYIYYFHIKLVDISLKIYYNIGVNQKRGKYYGSNRNCRRQKI